MEKAEITAKEMVGRFQLSRALLILGVFLLFLSGCAGRQTTRPSEEETYFIPRIARGLYINQTVNFLNDFEMGRNLTRILNRYYNQHERMRLVRHPDATLVLTVFLKNYELTKFATLDAYGRSHLEGELEAEITLIKRGSAARYITPLPSSRNDPPLSARQESSSFLLEREKITILAHSRDLPRGPSDQQSIRKIIFIKLTAVLDEYFRTGYLRESS